MKLIPEYLAALCEDIDRTLEVIHELGLEIPYIILTHGHGDHICGVPYYKQMFGAPIVGHKYDDFLHATFLNTSNSYH